MHIKKKIQLKFQIYKIFHLSYFFGEIEFMSAILTGARFRQKCLNEKILQTWNANRKKKLLSRILFGQYTKSKEYFKKKILIIMNLTNSCGKPTTCGACRKRSRKRDSLANGGPLLFVWAHIFYTFVLYLLGSIFEIQTAKSRCLAILFNLLNERFWLW